MDEIVDILAVFPLRHTLVVVASFALLPHAVRIAYEEGAYLVLYTKVDHLSRGLMAQVAHSPLDATRHLVPGALQLFPVTRVLLAPRLLFGKVPVPHVALALEAAYTAS